MFFYRWEGSRSFINSTDWNDGPQDSETYYFTIYALKSRGGMVTMKTGPVDFHCPELPAPTPTTTPTHSAGVDGETITVSLSLPADAKPLEMVKIPAGTFTMGSPENEQGRDSNEGPQHQVTISNDFYLGKYEVTLAQWYAVMGSYPSESWFGTFGSGDNYPIYAVSWDYCQAFITNLNAMDQGTFRLPTEAEWEYACRAGTTERFYWGDDPNETQIDVYACYLVSIAGYL